MYGKRVSQTACSRPYRHRLKSNPFGKLEAAGLNAEYVLDEAAKIMTKTSTLPSSQRTVLSTIMNDAMNLAIQRRQEKEAAEKAAAENKQ